MTAPLVWTLRGPATMLLDPGVEWADPMVRAEVRRDARTVSHALGKVIEIADAKGVIETIDARPS